MRTFIRTLSIIVFTLSWSVLAVGFIQTNVATWASTYHYDTILIKLLTWLGSRVPDLTGLVVSYWIWLGAGLAAGFTIGVWLDALLKWLRAKRKASTLVLPWNEKSRLKLIFDAELQSSSPIVLEGINYYYWYHVPSVAIDFDAKQASATVGYMMIFMALKEPSYTNHCKISVVGGGVPCELLAHHPTAAVVRLVGDLRGRTVDIQLGKDAIPIG